MEEGLRAKNLSCSTKTQKVMWKEYYKEGANIGQKEKNDVLKLWLYAKCIRKIFQGRIRGICSL